MKTKLRLQLMITCLIILPFISMAQKPLSSLKITAKQHVTVNSMLNHTGVISSELKNQLVQAKLNERFNLAQERNGKSALLPKNALNKSIVNAGNEELKTDQVDANSPPPLANFKGSKDNGSVYPPDASGAAGPNHLMHVNEQEYVIYDKTGTVLVSLSPDDFWSGFDGTAFPLAYPHVEYDAQLGHFYILTLGGDVSTGDYAVLFGASDTNDPTGSWTLWEVDMGPEFIQDAPVMGYSKRYFTYTTMQYDTAAPYNFNSSGVIFMSITEMIAGSITSGLWGVNDTNFFGLSPVETLDPNINNHYLISNLGSSADTGYLYVVHIAGLPNNPSYNYDGYVTKNQPWSATPVFASQNGTANKIYPGSTRLRNAVYRNGQIWTCHTVYVPEAAPTRAVAQWWQVKVSNLAVSQFGRVEDKKNNDKMYGYPSIAVNKHNDMLMGYTQFQSTKYASAAYSYRNGTDASNKLRKSAVYKKGKAAYFAGGSSGVTYNWGTYSSTCVDTDSSFWTIQEYAESPADTWGTWWAHVDNATFAAAASPAPMQSFDNRSALSISPNPANNFATLIWNEEKSVSVKIQVSDSRGNILIAKNLNTQHGNNKLTINVANLISGVYSVVISNGVDTKKAQLVIE